MFWTICFALFLCAFNAERSVGAEEIHGSATSTVGLPDFKSYVRDETHGSAISNAVLGNIVPSSFHDEVTSLPKTGKQEDVDAKWRIQQQQQQLNALRKNNNGNNLRRRRLQSASVEIINDCRYDFSIHVVYTQGGLMKLLPEWKRVGKYDSLIIEDVTGSKIWVYGEAQSYFEEDYKCDNSAWCKSDGNCYCEVELGSLASGSVRHRLCGRDEGRERPPQGTIQEISIMAQLVDPTASPTNPPTMLPTNPPTNPPTDPPTSPPTNPPTRLPTAAPTNHPTSPPTRPPTNPPTHLPTDQPTPRPIIFTQTDSAQDQWIHEHNSRRRHFYSLFDMEPLDLKWSDSIAESAQNYANKLVNVDGCHIEHGYQGDSYGGENLAMNYGSGRYNVGRTPASILEAWHDDEIDLNNMRLIGQKYHASQVLWRSSRYFGCAEAEKQMDNGAGCYIQVCRYIGVGNCFIESHAGNPQVDRVLPPGCMDQHPGWACSVLSDGASDFCSAEQCPVEGCF